jgi:glutaredoxin 3
MTLRVLIFTQSGCLSCELMKVFLEAREIAFEEHDVTTDREARRRMIEKYESEETPLLVIISGDVEEVVVGFDPVRLDQLLGADPSSDAVIAS